MISRTKIGSDTMGVVLVGTHPWANSAFDRLLPRTLLPVAHRPLLSYALSWLSDGGIHHAAVCANRETQMLRARLQRHVPNGMSVSYHEDVMPRGAAGALRDAAYASHCDTFIVTDGTSIPNVDLGDVLAHHRTSGAAMTILVHSESDRHGNSCAQVPTGIYVCNRDALEDIPQRGFYDLKENLIPQLYRTGQRVVAYTAAANPRVLDASSYLAVNEWMVEQLVERGDAPEGYVQSGSCLHHRDAVIADNVDFVGPVLVGPRARVMSGAVVVGPTSIGLEAVVNAGVLLSRSAVWRRCVIGENAIADRCILADDTVVETETQAFRAVMFTNFRQELLIPRPSEISLRDTVSVESLRKRMGRLATSMRWSRYPAAQ
jgi:NDP-sugar pyrophosphorylase family protein